MKNLKLLNSIIFQLLLLIVFSANLFSTEPVDIWKENSKVNIEEVETDSLDLEDTESSLFKKKQNLKSEIFQEENSDLDFTKVYGLFDPEENDLTLELWIESDGQVLLDHLKRIEKMKLSKDSE